MNTKNKTQIPVVTPVRFFVKCSGETNGRIIELLGSDIVVNAVYNQMHCSDGDNDLLELLFDKLAVVVRNKGFADLDVSFYIKIGNDLPAPVLIARESDFEVLVLKWAEMQSEPLDAETVRCFLCPPPPPKFRSEPPPERPHQRGVLPGNVTVRHYPGPKINIHVQVSHGNR